jgi:acetate kinase
VLVVNTGSSSVKLRLVGDDGTVLARHDVEGWDGDPAGSGVAGFAAALGGEPGAVAHRVVHGGDETRPAVLVEDGVRAALGELVDLAPLHQPRALAAIDAAVAALPGVPQVACLDTAFHATVPAAAATYALPQAWRERWGLRRYGFHGLSHGYASRRAAELVGPDRPSRRTVTLHLGAGASGCAVLDGRSVDTTMGLHPARRAGDEHPAAARSTPACWCGCCSTGSTSTTSATGSTTTPGCSAWPAFPDLRTVATRRAGGDPRAGLAWDVYVHRLAGATAGLVTSLGGLDVLVFTGGVGEHMPALRSAVAARLAHLGVALDPARNEAATSDGLIGGSAAGSTVSTLVVTAREDLAMAHHTRRLLADH